jgi:hypothetical protein
MAYDNDQVVGKIELLAHDIVVDSIKDLFEIKISKIVKRVRLFVSFVLHRNIFF